MNKNRNFKDYKFNVNNVEESKEVQKALFKLGYTWPFSKTECVWLSKPWLSTSVVGHIHWHEASDREEFYRCKLLTIDQLQKLVKEQSQ